jgi:hypothetical protein
MVQIERAMKLLFAVPLNEAFICSVFAVIVFEEKYENRTGRRSSSCGCGHRKLTPDLKLASQNDFGLEQQTARKARQPRNCNGFSMCFTPLMVCLQRGTRGGLAQKLERPLHSVHTGYNGTESEKLLKWVSQDVGLSVCSSLTMWKCCAR